MVNVRANTKWEVDALRLKSRDLLAQQLNRRCVVLAHGAEQLFVALVAAEDRVGKIEEDHGSFSKECVALVLLAALRHRFASSGGNRDNTRIEYALAVAGVTRASTWE